RIRALGENGSPESLRKLEEQLEKCFDLFYLPQFRNIVLENLKQLPKLQDRSVSNNHIYKAVRQYLDSIMNDRDFYDACPLSVKQQIWLRNLDLFKEAYRPSIDSYLKRKEDLLLSAEPTATNFFTFETTKARRQWKEIKDLITFVGNHEELFLAVMTYIRELFAATGDVMLCSLRYELIMAAHDASIEGIVKAGDLGEEFVVSNYLSKPSDRLITFLKADRCAKYQLLKLISQIGYIWGQPHCVTLLKEYDIEYFTRAGHEDLDYFIGEYNKLCERLMPKPIENMETDHEQVSGIV
ncbi:hypothetical protein TELCIR_06910, partial [Teladorsagia circumcincta]